MDSDPSRDHAGGIRSGRCVELGYLALALVFLSACASTPKDVTPKTVALTLTLSAAAQLNPDDRGRASPVLLRLYTLTDSSLFAASDYFSLDGDGRQLAKEILSREEVVMRPGEVLQWKRTMSADAREIGVVVGYRDIARAHWRELYHLPMREPANWLSRMLPAPVTALHIQLDPEAVSISLKE
jgi:type VI secretion system protein VasD